MMVWWHRVGQRVVCVNDTPCDYRPIEVVRGQVYVIREVFWDPHYPRHAPHFRLKELRFDVGVWLLGTYEPGFQHKRFRPVKDTSIESLRALLDQPPDPALVRDEDDAKFVEKQRQSQKARMDALCHGEALRRLREGRCW